MVSLSIKRVLCLAWIDVFHSSCLQEGARLICVIRVCLRIVVSNIYCVVSLLCLSSSYVACVAIFSGFSIFCIAPSVFSRVYMF
jgi:hypothetical protein